MRRDAAAAAASSLPAGATANVNPTCTSLDVTVVAYPVGSTVLTYIGDVQQPTSTDQVDAQGNFNGSFPWSSTEAHPWLVVIEGANGEDWFEQSGRREVCPPEPTEPTTTSRRLRPPTSRRCR